MTTSGNGKGLLSLYDSSGATIRPLDDGLRDLIANEVIDQINREFPVEKLQTPSESERQHKIGRAHV